MGAGPRPADLPLVRAGTAGTRPESLGDTRLETILWEVIRKLYQKRIVLDFTDHLSDRELYCLIYRDILPAREKKLEHISHYLHWDCTGPSGDPDVWLRYYASDEEREEWSDCYGEPLPDREVPPYPRISAAGGVASLGGTQCSFRRRACRDGDNPPFASSSGRATRRPALNASPRPARAAPSARSGPAT